jgi:hypothetical protein
MELDVTYSHEVQTLDLTRKLPRSILYRTPGVTRLPQ